MSQDKSQCQFCRQYFHSDQLHVVVAENVISGEKLSCLRCNPKLVGYVTPLDQDELILLGNLLGQGKREKKQIKTGKHYIMDQSGKLIHKKGKGK